MFLGSLMGATIEYNKWIQTFKLLKMFLKHNTLSGFWRKQKQQVKI